MVAWRMPASAAALPKHQCMRRGFIHNAKLCIYRAIPKIGFSRTISNGSPKLHLESPLTQLPAHCASALPDFGSPFFKNTQKKLPLQNTNGLPSQRSSRPTNPSDSLLEPLFQNSVVPLVSSVTLKFDCVSRCGFHSVARNDVFVLSPLAVEFP
jgi:hypothetical protein